MGRECAISFDNIDVVQLVLFFFTIKEKLKFCTVFGWQNYRVINTIIGEVLQKGQVRSTCNRWYD